MVGAVKLSVIIPCRNAAPYLEAALKSARDQSTPPDEIIVIDDGSTDDSAAIAAAMPSVRLHRQPPLGIGTARNVGLEQARGSIIAFLDADDLWPADSLRVRLQVLEAASGIDGACGRTEQFLSPELAVEKSPPVPSGAATARLAGATLLRRSVFDRIGGFDPKLALGDMMDLVARMDEAGMRIATVDDIVLRRRIHATNTVLTQRHRQGDYLRVLKAALDRRRGSAMP